MSFVVRLYTDLSKSINMHLFIGQIRVYTVFLKCALINMNFFGSICSCCFVIRMPKDFHWTGGTDYNHKLKMAPFRVFLSLEKTVTSYFKFQMEWGSKVNLFSWNWRDLTYSKLLETPPVINPGLMKRMDLGHDPEPIVVNGRLFPLTSSGFGSGLYYLKWINSQQNLP